MITPFNEKFRFEEYQITQSLIQKGYIVFQYIPNLNTISVDLSEGNTILSTGYIIEEVTENNYQLYPDGNIGQYILTWEISSSSSSSSSTQQLELKILLESGNYSAFQVRYISVD